MGGVSDFFKPRKLSAEQIASGKMILLQKKLRDLTLRIAHKRISVQEGGGVPFEKLQQLSDNEVSSLPENSIVTMAAIYRRCKGEGAPHELALQIVNSTRIMPIK